MIESTAHRSGDVLDDVRGSGERVFRVPDGTWYHVHLASQNPRTGRQHPRVQWLCYWTREGQWAGAAPVSSECTMTGMGTEELIGPLVSLIAVAGPRPVYHLETVRLDRAPG